MDEQYRGPESDTDYDSSEEQQRADDELYFMKNRRAMLLEYGEDPADYDEDSDSEHSFCDAEAMDADFLSAEELFSLYRASEPKNPIDRGCDLLQ